MVAPVGESYAHASHTPSTLPMVPIAAAMSIMVSSRSVNIRAAAAGVIRSATTRMLPTVCTASTTAKVTLKYSARSSAATGRFMARAVSRSRATAVNQGRSTITTPTINAPTTALMSRARVLTPVSEPKRKELTEAV